MIDEVATRKDLPTAIRARHNREVFVLCNTDNIWKIILYTFSAEPVQGHG